ncbi:murein hydrolase activator EnvC family protein [Streptomyces sp. NPDC060194]|uniref:murein hydrolase activator EnvC family protein n=1 Tax=Streptomyces sp. NPDC060194 TaxID=3347069 RepID=UPI003660B558
MRREVSAGVWPVGPGGAPPRIVRGWVPPASPYGPGHRGVDLAAEPGAEVRAVRDGRVAFAGPVGGRGVLVVELSGSGDPPLRTTFEPVRPLAEAGARVTAGDVVAALDEPAGHCAQSCLHWGLRRADAYLNPLHLIDRPPSRLLPVAGVPLPR